MASNEQQHPDDNQPFITTRGKIRKLAEFINSQRIEPGFRHIADQYLGGILAAFGPQLVDPGYSGIMGVGQVLGRFLLGVAVVNVVHKSQIIYPGLIFLGGIAWIGAQKKTVVA